MSIELILEYLGGIETEAFRFLVAISDLILEYLGGIETLEVLNV